MAWRAGASKNHGRLNGAGTRSAATSTTLGISYLATRSGLHGHIGGGAIRAWRLCGRGLRLHDWRIALGQRRPAFLLADFVAGQDAGLDRDFVTFPAQLWVAAQQSGNVDAQLVIGRGRGREQGTLGLGLDFTYPRAERVRRIPAGCGFAIGKLASSQMPTNGGGTWNSRASSSVVNRRDANSSASSGLTTSCCHFRPASSRSTRAALRGPAWNSLTCRVRLARAVSLSTLSVCRAPLGCVPCFHMLAVNSVSACAVPSTPAGTGEPRHADLAVVAAVAQVEHLGLKQAARAAAHVVGHVVAEHVPWQARDADAVPFDGAQLDQGASGRRPRFRDTLLPRSRQPARTHPSQSLQL